MDSKGQAFSVFKLLIAAVVAGAILVILFQVLAIIPDPGGQAPNEVAASNVKSQQNKAADLKIVRDVTFKPGDVLNHKTISSDSDGLSSSQVCVLLSDNAPNYDAFEADGAGKVITYNGSYSQKVRLLIVCDRYDDLTNETLSTYSTDDKYGVDESGGDCEAPSNDSSNYCIVAVISDQ